MKKSLVQLADGRELIYFDSTDGEARDAYPDTRPLGRGAGASETRFDPVQGEWIAIAGHRQERPYHPAADVCPLCPSSEGRQSEIPAPDYEVVVFENRFPSLGGPPDPEESLAGPLPHRARNGGGRCEVVCFTSDHDASFAQLGEKRTALVLEAWTDRTAQLSAMPGIRQIYCFENRGTEIGVTLSHPHGQIYAFPYLTPKTAQALRNASEHHTRTGGNLFDDVVAAELAGERVILQNREWVAFVPFAARWPYEAHLYPKRRVHDFTELDTAQRAAFPEVYLDLLGRFDRIFKGVQNPTPYIAAWHQAPVGFDGARPDLALHLELFTVRRAADKLKYLAGTESGMGAFMNDVPPEAAARTLREAAR
ncbi:MAG TPA: galactose-1-phosphate uridylyltransferase [Actinocrinis sp.]